ncbi:hypothetical protein ES703_97295 [subsurface metagenome]
MTIPGIFQYLPDALRTERMDLKARPRLKIPPVRWWPVPTMRRQRSLPTRLKRPGYKRSWMISPTGSVNARRLRNFVFGSASYRCSLKKPGQPPVGAMVVPEVSLPSCGTRLPSCGKPDTKQSFESPIAGTRLKSKGLKGRLTALARPA